jgi:predicted phosphodiesterase
MNASSTSRSATDTSTSRRTTVGLIADTHCSRADGTDLPATVITALRGCDLIVHLGDLISIGVLDRLAECGAEVVGVRNPRLDPPVGTDPRLVDGPLFRELQGRRLAMLREYPVDDISADVIAYGVPRGGGGHDHRVALVGSTLIVTPGSPTLPVRDRTVARLTFGDDVDVEIVHLPT